MKDAGAKPPIATHPAFPFIVALWFAALLGLGSLMVPVPLVESLTVATGLASIVPATAPPLGFTARALMAIAFAGGGALAGLVIARQVARAQRVEPARRTNPVAADRTAADRRPISAHDELGDDGLDGVSKLTNPLGRRALTGEAEQAPPELPEAAAPEHMPEARPSRRIGLTALSQQPEAHGEPEALALDEAPDELELTDEALETHEPDPVAAEATPGFTTFSSTFEADASRNDTMDDRQFFHAAGEAASHDREERQEFHFPSPEPDRSPVAPSINLSWDDEPETIAEDMAAVDAGPQMEAGDEGHAADALDFSPPSLARQVIADDDWSADEQEYRKLSAEYDSEEVVADHGADEDDARPLDDMGLVQLAQRLGASIERRREMRAAKVALAASAARQPVAAPAVAAIPDGLAQQFGLAEPDEAAEAMVAYFSRPAPVADEAAQAQVAEEPAIPGEEAWDEPVYREPVPVYPNAEIEPEPAPRQMFEPAPEPADTPQVFEALAGLARIDIDDDDYSDGDEDIADLAASFSLPLSRLSLAQHEPAHEPVEEPGDEPGFASQLTPGNPFHQQPHQFVRIEDEPLPAMDEAEPAVVFPAEAMRTAHQPADQPAHQPAPFESPAFQAQARINSEEHERALRDALLNLQRMSGAA